MLEIYFVYFTQRLTPLYPQALVRLLKQILEMLDALLIIFPKAYRLGRPQNLFKVGLELGLFSLCNVKMILDNPLQAPRPEPIPVVTDWIEYLAMGVLELSAGKFPGKVGCDATLHALFTIRWRQGLNLDVFRTLCLAGACESGQNVLQNN